MNSRDFCYWLRGFFELAGEDPLTKEQVKVVSDHLKLVMKKDPKPSDYKSSDALLVSEDLLPAMDRAKWGSVTCDKCGSLLVKINTTTSC